MNGQIGWTGTRSRRHRYRQQSSSGEFRYAAKSLRRLLGHGISSISNRFTIIYSISSLLVLLIVCVWVSSDKVCFVFDCWIWMMDIDSGNLSAVARVISQERGKQQDAIVDLEKRDENGTEERVHGSEAPESSNGKEEDELPFSAARSIFFVLALTGAAFLNVCKCHAVMNHSWKH